MTKQTIIKNARLINEGKDFCADIKLTGERIGKIASTISANNTDRIIDAHGMFLLPGMIDDQVHFREPGLTHKGTIASESRAAVAGGITSYMEMPNVNPATTTIEALEAKYEIARFNSAANYAFYLGATEKNLEQIKLLDPTRHCGVKVFMGASTGNLLVEDPSALEAIFREDFQEDHFRRVEDIPCQHPKIPLDVDHVPKNQFPYNKFTTPRRTSF